MAETAAILGGFLCTYPEVITNKRVQKERNISPNSFLFIVFIIDACYRMLICAGLRHFQQSIYKRFYLNSTLIPMKHSCGY